MGRWAAQFLVSNLSQESYQMGRWYLVIKFLQGHRLPRTANSKLNFKKKKKSVGIYVQIKTISSNNVVDSRITYLHTQNKTFFTFVTSKSAGRKTYKALQILE